MTVTGRQRYGRNVGELQRAALQRVGLHDALVVAHRRPLCVRLEAADFAPLLNEMKDDVQSDAEHADDDEYLSRLYV